jgi:hypothetical protein
MTDNRFEYARFKSRDRAELALEDMYASGDVFEAECPLIERRSTINGTRWVITLPAE